MGGRPCAQPYGIVDVRTPSMEAAARGFWGACRPKSLRELDPLLFESYQPHPERALSRLVTRRNRSDGSSASPS